MKHDILIWIIIFGIIFIIFGLYLSDFTSLNLNEKKTILDDKNLNIENFSPKVSSYSSQEKGSSRLYKWGLPKKNVKKCVDKKDTSNDDIPSFSPKPIENVEYCAEEINPCVEKEKDKNCYTCDITSNRDIDKYVLKSSVPPCPDISKYATKNMIQSCPDISKYILKSEIPSCPKIDKSKYILKSEVPACPKCPVCPVCPICPKCPKQQKCKTINNYNITEHPDYNKYILAEDCQDYSSSESNNSNNNGSNNNGSNNNGSNNNGSNNNGSNNNGSNNNSGSINGEEGIGSENCNYSKLLDRVFTSKSNKVKDLQGLYVGDSLYASV